MNPLIRDLKPVLCVFIGFGVLNLGLGLWHLFAFPLRATVSGVEINTVLFPYLALHIYARRGVDDLQLLSKCCRVILSIGLVLLTITLAFLVNGHGVGNRAMNCAEGAVNVVVATITLWGFHIIRRHSAKPVR